VTGLAAPGRNESFLDSFCKDTGIVVEWHLEDWFGALLGRPSTPILGVEESSAGPAPAVFWLTSSSARMLREGDHLLTLDDHLYLALKPAPCAVERNSLGCRPPAVGLVFYRDFAKLAAPNRIDFSR
jgi:hypothetical protein